MTGRQLARVMIHPYRESVLSHLYPGYQHSSNCLVPAVRTFEERLALPAHRHAKIVWRLDRGFGGDAKLNWLLARQYHLLAKGASHRRSAKLATQVHRWVPLGPNKWVGRVPTPAAFVHPVDTFALRYQTVKGWKHAYLLSSLGLSGRATAGLYDQRGGPETEFRTDKSGGLHLHKRRKHKRDAQEVWLLLTDMVHNYLADLTPFLFHDTRFATFGALRITRDLFRIPGHVELAHGQLVSVKLLKSSPYAVDLLPCLARFWE